MAVAPTPVAVAPGRPAFELPPMATELFLLARVWLPMATAPIPIAVAPGVPPASSTPPMATDPCPVASAPRSMKPPAPIAVDPSPLALAALPGAPAPMAVDPGAIACASAPNAEDNIWDAVAFCPQAVAVAPPVSRPPLALLPLSHTAEY